MKRSLILRHYFSSFSFLFHFRGPLLLYKQLDLKYELCSVCNVLIIRTHIHFTYILWIQQYCIILTDLFCRRIYLRVFQRYTTTNYYLKILILKLCLFIECGIGILPLRLKDTVRILIQFTVLFLEGAHFGAMWPLAI
jgi:hypothetical protein